MNPRRLFLILALLFSAQSIAQSAADVQWDVPRDPPNQDTGGASYTPPPGMDPESLRYMEGTALECKNVISGTYKCCRQPVPNQEGVWWKTYKEATRQFNAHAVACKAKQEPGGWSEYKEGADYKTLQKRTTGEQENLDGGGASVGCDENGSVEQMQQSFMEQEDSSVKPDLAWYCDDQEFKLAVQRNVGECSYVGTKCVSDVLGVCMVEKEVYCCFNSPVSKEIRESQLQPGQTFGTADAPNCQGLSAQEVSQLNLANVHVKTVLARMTSGQFLDSPSDPALEDKLTGSGSAMGNAGRKNYSTRTGERMSQLKYSSEQTSVEDSQKVVLPTTTTEVPKGPGHLSFTLPEGQTSCDRWLVLEVSRDGGEGAVSVILQPQSFSNSGTLYAVFGPTLLTWPSGDTSNRLVRVRVLHPQNVAYAFFELVTPTGGATIAPYGQSIIKVDCSIK